MTVVMGVYGTNRNMNVKFPLKNFSKSYKKLTKK